LRVKRWRLEIVYRWLYFKYVGKTYHFECPVCQYRAKLSGGADNGLHCEVQTMICRDCRELFDVFTRLRRREGFEETIKFPAFFRPEIPPVILRENNGGKPCPLVWKKFTPACPVSAKHFVETWNDPGRCPRCGNFLEKNGLPFRLWD